MQSGRQDSCSLAVSSLLRQQLHTSAGQAPNRASASATPSQIKVDVRPGGPVILTTTSAEFQILPSGYIQASLLKGDQKLTLDESARRAAAIFCCTMARRFSLRWTSVRRRFRTAPANWAGASGWKFPHLAGRISVTRFSARCGSKFTTTSRMFCFECGIQEQRQRRCAHRSRGRAAAQV